MPVSAPTILIIPYGLDFKGGSSTNVEFNEDLSLADIDSKVVPIFENTINSARNIEVLHNLIKNNGQNFNLTQEEKELAIKLSIQY